MADERFCRFATKIVVAGVTLVDGMMSVPMIDMCMGKIMHDTNMPQMDFRALYAAKKGDHVHYDITVNGDFIACEIDCHSDPVGAEADIG